MKEFRFSIRKIIMEWSRQVKSRILLGALFGNQLKKIKKKEETIRGRAIQAKQETMKYLK